MQLPYQKSHASFESLLFKDSNDIKQEYRWSYELKRSKTKVLRRNWVFEILFDASLDKIDIFQMITVSTFKNLNLMNGIHDRVIKYW